MRQSGVRAVARKPVTVGWRSSIQAWRLWLFFPIGWSHGLEEGEGRVDGGVRESEGDDRDE